MKKLISGSVDALELLSLFFGGGPPLQPIDYQERRPVGTAEAYLSQNTLEKSAEWLFWNDPSLR